MYTTAIETLGRPGRGRLGQYEISNFAVRGHESRHNLRYWQRRPYLGLGLDASSMLREALHAADLPAANKSAEGRPEPGYVLRFNTTDDLGAYLAGPQPVETAWLSPASQHEEAWFLGLRRNVGVHVAALRREFGRKMVAPAMEVVGRMVERGLLTSDGKTVRLTAQGQLLSNDVFQEFLGLPATSAGADHLQE